MILTVADNNYYHFPSFNLTLSTLGTCLIVSETLVVRLSTSPQLTGVPKCDRLQILSETISSALWSIPCKYFWYISSFSTSKLLGSSRRESRNLDSRLVSSCCIWRKNKLHLLYSSILEAFAIYNTITTSASVMGLKKSKSVWDPRLIVVTTG